MSMTVRTYESRIEQAAGLARACVMQLSQTILAKGVATLAVPGGTTPAPFLEALSGEAVDWSAVRVMPTDERLVPDTSERSNARLIKAHLMQGEAASAQFVPLTPEDMGQSAEASAEEVAATILDVLPLDICVLGMGADMHTASLFPDGDRLADAMAFDAPTVLSMRTPAAPEPRLTLTASVLTTATHLHILITGEAKLDALNAAARTPAMEAPVRVILDAPAGVTVHYAV